MSSIDKDMQSIASGYDSRVRVRNTSVSKGYNGCNGQIKFYIGNECILSIKDRYGVIYAEERDQIRDAILRYQAREQREIREREQERIAREREEARRREEQIRRLEAERTAAYRSLVAAVANAKRSLESSYATVTQAARDLQQKTNAIITTLSSAKFDVSVIMARLNELLRAQKTELDKITEEHCRKIKSITRFEEISSSQTTESYRAKQKELSSISTLLTSASFNQEEVAQAGEYVRLLLSAHDELIDQREQFCGIERLGGTVGEIAKIILNQIENVDKNSLEQINEVLSRAREAKKEIGRCKDEEAFLRVGEELRNAPSVSQVSQKVVLRQSSYEYVDYTKQCDEAANVLRRAYEAVVSRGYSTATREELEIIEQALQQFSVGMASKNLLNELRAMTDLVRLIHEDDEANREVFDEYWRLKQALESLGEQVEQIDVFNYGTQREKLLNNLYARYAEIEMNEQKEEAEDKRSMLSLGVRSAFSDQGLYFVTGRISDMETAEELIFAIPGVDDVVIKAIITEDSLHWFVCGTEKEDGSVVSAERVLEVMRAFDRSNKPQKILNSLSQSLNVRQAEINGATDSASENAIDIIVGNGTFSLSEELRSEDGGTVTAGEVMRHISETFAKETEQNRLIYATGEQTGKTLISKTVKHDLGAVDVRVLRKKMQEIHSRDKSYARQPKRRPINQQRLRYHK